MFFQLQLLSLLHRERCYFDDFAEDKNGGSCINIPFGFKAFVCPPLPSRRRISILSSYNQSKKNWLSHYFFAWTWVLISVNAYALIFNLGRRMKSGSTCKLSKVAKRCFTGNILQTLPWGCTGAWPRCSVIICPINQTQKTETLALKCYSSGLWGLRQQAEANVDTFGLYIFSEMCKIRFYQLFIVFF